jgi:hypothetical protein
MKMRYDGTAKNQFGKAKLERRTRRPWYRRKCVQERKHMKKDPTPSVPSKMSSAAQNIKIGPDALNTAENESGSAKHENGTRRPRFRRKCVRERKTSKREPTPFIPPKLSPREQNKKTGHHALGSFENRSESTKHESGTRRPRYSQT